MGLLGVAFKQYRTPRIVCNAVRGETILASSDVAECLRSGIEKREFRSRVVWPGKSG